MKAARLVGFRPRRDDTGYQVTVLCGRDGCGERLGTVWLPPVHVLLPLPPQWHTGQNWFHDAERNPPRWRQPRRPGRRRADAPEGLAFPDRVPLPAVAECPRCRAVLTIALTTVDPQA